MQMNSYNNLITFTKAINFAAFKHRNQRRKNGDIPYINHPIEVAHILANAGVTDYEVLSAAVLHDTIQDTETTPKQLQDQFGTTIRDYVLQCTDDKSLAKIQRKKIQIIKAAKATNGAKLVKIGDKLSNCWDLNNKAPKGWSEERKAGYFVWAFCVCQGLRGVNQKLDQEMDRLFQIVGINALNEKDISSKLEQYYGVLGEYKNQTD